MNQGVFSKTALSVGALAHAQTASASGLAYDCTLPGFHG
jgi:hypothetical protein